MKKRILCLFTLLCFMISSFNIIAFAEGNNSNKVKCNIDLAKSQELDFNYNDSYFVGTSGYDFNLELARATLVLELSAFTAKGAKTAEQRYANIKHAYEIIGINETNVSYVNYDKDLNDNTDKAAYSIATKKLPDNSDLIIAVVRGGGYGAEWASNFRLGEGNYHMGFKTPANEIYSKIDALIKEKSIDTTKAKIWITGYSRGAAIGNLVSGMINENSLIKPENLYSYLFAVPAGVEIKPTSAKAEVHNNIYNIVSPYDIVPRVVMESWGFGRYGKDMYFKNRNPYGTNNNENYFYNITENSYQLAKAHTYSGKTAADALADIVENKTNYVNLYQNFFCDVAEGVMCHSDDLNRFVKNKYENNSKYENSTKFAYNKCVELIETVAYYSEFEAADMDSDAIWKYLYPILTIAYIDGVNEFAKEVLYNKLSSVIEILLQIENLGSTINAHYPEYYISWLNGYNNPKDIFEMKTYKAITVSSLANVNVYDENDVLVASVVNGSASVNELPVELIGGYTKVYIPTDTKTDEYKIELTAKADGLINYSVLEYDNYSQTRQVNYKDISMKKNETALGYVSTELDCYSSCYDLTLNDNTISCYDDLYGYYLDLLSVNVNVEGNGEVSKVEALTEGELATLCAYPTKDSQFVGWYDNNNKLIYEDDNYAFIPYDDVSLVAKFTKKGSNLNIDEAPLLQNNELIINADATYENGAKGAIYYVIYDENDEIIYCNFKKTAENSTKLSVNETVNTSALSKEPCYIRYFLLSDNLSPMVKSKTAYIISL